MARQRDTARVRRHDDELLRTFLLARRAGDEAGARDAWDALVALQFDRVRTMVLIESRAYLSREEAEDALQLALENMLVNLIRTFRGTSMGQWVEATRTLVRFACRTTQRRAARHSTRAEPLGDEDRLGATTEHDEDEDGAEIAFLDWAVPRLTGRRREVVELDRIGLPVAEMQTRLGMSRDAVYAARSRALKDLASLRGEYEAP